MSPKKMERPEKGREKAPRERKPRAQGLAGAPEKKGRPESERARAPKKIERPKQDRRHAQEKSGHPEQEAEASRPFKVAWRFTGRLLPEISRETAYALEGYGCLLRKAMPLKPKHFKDLPFQIKALSKSLTSERGVGPPSGYMSEDKSLAAYAWYFLPWNMYRLARLLTNLDLNLPEGATILDIGAGPLTFVQSLWLARPDLRKKRLSFLCLDTSLKTMRLGADLFDLLRDETGGGKDADGEPLWRVQTVRGLLHKAPRVGADLVVAANIINELGFSRAEILADRMDMVAETLADAAAPTGRLLVIEPGVRSSGKSLARLRDSFLGMGLSLLAPCPQDGRCPLDGPAARTWCHFNVRADSAPQWLAELSRMADLPKSNVALAFLLAAAPEAERSRGLTRIISNVFHPEGGPGPDARYGCFSGGLGMVLTQEQTDMISGDLIDADWAAKPGRDQKSGAARVVLGKEAPRAPGLSEIAPPKAALRRCAGTEILRGVAPAGRGRKGPGTHRSKFPAKPAKPGRKK